MRKNLTSIYEVWKGIVTEGEKRKRACENRLVGIKNSWKYEKDLIIIFNIINALVPIGLVGDFCIGQVGKSGS